LSVGDAGAPSGSPRPMGSLILFVVACASLCVSLTCGDGPHAAPGRHARPRAWGSGAALPRPEAAGCRALRGGSEVRRHRALAPRAVKIAALAAAAAC
jgi:hypothetical protein